MMYKGKVAVRAKAFTLIELMVSVGIMTLVLGITLMQKPEATLRLSLADSMNSLELTLRQAQLQGSAVNSVTGLYGGAGVYLDLGTSTKALRFRDRIDTNIPSTLGVGDGLYNQGAFGEREEELNFLRGNKIKKICVSMSTSTFLCNDAHDPEIKNLTLSFKRPNPTVNIYINNTTDISYGSACIQLETLKAPGPGHVRSLYVYQAGIMSKRMSDCQ